MDAVDTLVNLGRYLPYYQYLYVKKQFMKYATEQGICPDIALNWALEHLVQNYAIDNAR